MIDRCGSSMPMGEELGGRMLVVMILPLGISRLKPILSQAWIVVVWLWRFAVIS